jgi:hypothetical protein
MSHPLLPRLRIYRLKNAQRYVYAAARDERDALKMADRKYDDLEPWSALYCGTQHDGKARTRGLLEHEQVMKLFAMPRVRE